MSVMRFEVGKYGINPCEHGNYVSHDCYMALLDDFDIIAAELKLVRGQLNDRVQLENRGLINLFREGK